MSNFDIKSLNSLVRANNVLPSPYDTVNNYINNDVTDKNTILHFQEKTPLYVMTPDGTMHVRTNPEQYSPEITSISYNVIA